MSVDGIGYASLSRNSAPERGHRSSGEFESRFQGTQGRTHHLIGRSTSQNRSQIGSKAVRTFRVSKNGVQVLGAFDGITHPKTGKQIADCMNRPNRVKPGLKHIVFLDVSLKFVDLNGHSITAEF